MAYAPALSTTGQQVASKVVFAIERLKEKFPASVKAQDLLSYAFHSNELQDEDRVRQFRQFLSVNSKVTHNSAENTYRFRPYLDIASPDELIAYFQKQDSSTGIHVSKLKDGWPDCEEAIDKLEAEHKLVVLRNKKDNHPRMVWADDPDLNAPLDKEFVDLWYSITIPSKDETIRQLQAMNHTPTGEIIKNVPTAAPTKKIKKVRRGAKVTNTHMAGMLRDYSAQRPKGK